MSSPEDEDARFPSSPRLQSAQQSADHLYAADEELDLASDYLSDVPSNRKSSSQQSSQRPSDAGDDLGANQSAAEDEHQDILDEDSQDSTSVPSRPNKFRGPPSTWRNWTAPERDLAASLDHLQAKDLSVHLYNSFKLGHRNHTRNPGWQAPISEDLGAANEGSNWIPPKVWTAWPLPPGIVPREHDEGRWEEDAVLSELYHSKPKRPGRYLQEMLVAQILRKAKERFRDRLRGDIAQQSANPTKRSQSRRRDSKGRFDANEYNEVPDQKPVTMADDQRASEILRPTVQHMMTKLDDLLMGLHHARSAYLVVQDSGSDSQNKATERSTSRGRPQKRKREAPISDEDEVSHEMPNNPGSESEEHRTSRKQSGSKGKIQLARSSSRRSLSQSFRGRKGPLGLRDWSDVLGIASMTGWNQKIVGSATARCATLFGEGMKFRTLEEGKVAQEEHLYLPDATSLVYPENNQRNTRRAREAFSNRFEGEMVGGVHVDGFLKPIEGKKSWMYSNNKQSKQRQPSRKSGG